MSDMYVFTLYTLQNIVLAGGRVTLGTLRDTIQELLGDKALNSFDKLLASGEPYKWIPEYIYSGRIKFHKEE